MYKHILSIFRVLVALDQRSANKRSIYLLPGSLCLACPAHIARAPYPFAASLIIIPWYLLPDVSFISVDGRRRTGWTWRSRESDGTSFMDRPISLVSLRSRARVSISKRSSLCIEALPMHPWGFERFLRSSKNFLLFLSLISARYTNWIQICELWLR